MRTETTTRTLYTFKELTEDGKDKAIIGLSDLNVFDEWWNDVYGDAKNIGLKIDGFDIDRGAYCKGRFTISANEAAQNILNDHGETCETYKTAESFMEKWQPVFDHYTDSESADYESREVEEELLEIENDFLQSLLEDYRLMLSREYDYLTSREAIVESIEAIECEFTADGGLY